VKLYDYYRSSASYRVRIALNIKNISYETLPVHLVHNGGEQHQPEYTKLNPQELVPTLDENGHILTQSLAIIEYLEDISPLPALMPANPLARAQVRSLALIIAADVHPLNNLRVLQQLRQQFHADEQQVLDWYHLWLKKGFDAFENILHQLTRKNPVCYGSEVTLADICLIPQVYNAQRFNFPLDNYPLITEINEYCTSLPPFLAAAPEAEVQVMS
jgi:maleylacetoacetate isomerase